LKQRMHEGIAHFVYIRKSDGKEREAFGTVKSELVPKHNAVQVDALIEASRAAFSKIGITLDNSPEDFVSDPDGFRGNLLVLEKALKPLLPKEGKTTAREPNPAIVTYYDLESQGWRAFGIENLVKVI